MDSKTILQKVSQEIMCFMRGKYVSDEVGNGVDELKFINAGETLFTIYICDGYYEFAIDTAEGNKRIHLSIIRN